MGTTTSPAIGVAAHEDETPDAVSVDEDATDDDDDDGQGPSQDPSPHETKSRGGETCCPHGTKSRGATIKRAPKADIVTPVSASVPHTTEESIWPAGVCWGLT